MMMKAFISYKMSHLYLAKAKYLVTSRHLNKATARQEHTI